MNLAAELTYRIAILEDDDAQRKVLQDALDKHPASNTFSVHAFSCISQLEECLAGGGSFDVLVCDISLPDGKNAALENAGESREAMPAVNSLGIDFVKKWSASGNLAQVIYVSGYTNYCSEVYSTDHVWFLMKPVVQADLNRAIDKAIANLRRSAAGPIGVMVDGDIMLIHPRRILYVESRLRKAHIHAIDGVHETYSSLSKIEERLPQSFVRCHKSFLVNIDYAKKLERDRIILMSGETVPVSQRHRKDAREAFMAYLVDC